MKISILTFLLIGCSISVFSQIVYEPGYYIDNKDDRHEGLIRNADWKNNPVKIQFKRHENDDAVTILKDNLKEFAVGNAKFKRATVDVDKSSEQSNKLSENPQPEFLKETTLLRFLVEGKTNLYIYEESNLVRFFINKKGDDIHQLVYKKFLNPDRMIAYNKRYRQQLWSEVRCEGMGMSFLEKVEYNRAHLVNYFKKYNECTGDEYINYETKRNKNNFNLYLRVGMTSGALEYDHLDFPGVEIHFGSNKSLLFGIDLEYILPFNKNKLGISFAPTFQQYESTVPFGSTGLFDVTAKYQSIELPLGVRNYIYFTDEFKLLIGGGYNFDVTMNSEIDQYASREVKSVGNFFLELGIRFKNRYHLGTKYNLKRDIYVNYVNFYAPYKTLSIIAGIRLF